MLETLFGIVGGAIAYSTFQGLRRGKVSEEERAKNPTLMERVYNGAEVLLSETQCRLRTEEHAKWFGMFERTVSSHLDIAESRLAIEEQLDADPKLREIFNKLSAEQAETTGEKFTETAPKAEPDWVKDGPPSAPILDSDPEITQSYNKIFQWQIKQHREFVNTARERLRRKPMLKKTFEDMMIEAGYKSLFQDYFIEG